MTVTTVVPWANVSPRQTAVGPMTDMPPAVDDPGPHGDGGIQSVAAAVGGVEILTPAKIRLFPHSSPTPASDVQLLPAACRSAVIRESPPS